MLGRAGLPWDGWPGGEKAEEWWSSDRAQQNANRRKYHGLKLSSLQIVNALIRGALAVANRDALKQARRFPFKLRYPLYVAGAMHIRNLQVIEAFPVLAVAIFEERKFGAYKYHPLTVAEARDMILRGKPLRDIAKIMSVPWVLKRVKPGAVREACHGGPSTIEASLIEAYLPWRVRDMKTWFLATHSAQDVSPDFVRWCARNAMSLGDDFEMVVQDIGDWVNASFNGIVPGDEQFIPRAFHSGISLETVLKLSGEWHEAVARDLSGPQCRFPPPWFPAQSIEDYELVPIDNAVALYLEGKTMYHCVASRSYVEAARMGRLCICSIRRQGKRVATIALLTKE
jgi:hypothetical protein